MSTDGRIPWRQIDEIPADLGAPSTALVPWTTTTVGEPVLMWDDNDNLMLIEVPR